MSGMAESKRDHSVMFLGQMLAASVLWAVTFVLTKGEWAQHAASLPARVGVAVLGIGGFLPIVFVYTKSIRIQDEFNQRIHLIALAVAFAATATISYAADILHLAGFIPPLPAAGMWALMIAIWFVCMLVTSRRYR